MRTLFNKQKDCLKRDMKDVRFTIVQNLFVQVNFWHLLLAKTRSVDLAYVCAKRNLVNVRAFNKDDFLMPVIVLCAIWPRDTSRYSMRNNFFSIGNLISIIPEMRMRNDE